MTLPARAAAAITFSVIAGVPLFALGELLVPDAQTPAQVAANCEKAKRSAAAHAENGFDETSLTDGAVYKDNCVAAILAPNSNPKKFSSYQCVGKRTRLTVTPAGRVFDSSVPDPSVPAGKCVTTACTDNPFPPTGCISADTPTSIFEQTFKFLNSFLPVDGGNAAPSAYPMNIGIRG